MPANTPRTILKTLLLVYFSIPLVLVLFTGMIVFLIERDTNYSGNFESYGLLFKYAVYGLTPAFLAAGYFLYRRQIVQVDKTISLGEKLSKLQGILLVRSGLMEVPALFGAVAAMLTGDLSFLLFTGIVIAFFIVWRPTRETIATDLQLTSQQQGELSD